MVIDIECDIPTREVYQADLDSLETSGDQGMANYINIFGPKWASDIGMSLAEFEDFVYGTVFADQEDPIAAWNAVHDEQQRLVDWLVGKKKVEVRGANVELTLSIDGRSFINSDGTHNMPSGEIFSGPVEDSVNGWIRFSYPAIYGSREVAGMPEGSDFLLTDADQWYSFPKQPSLYLLSQMRWRNTSAK